MGKLLYNPQGGKIYPITDASSVSYVYGGNNTNVGANLNTIWDKLSAIDNDILRISGATELAEALSIHVYYTTTNEDKQPAADSITGTTYIKATTSNPYVWKKTVYEINGKTACWFIELVTAALYPETLFLYAATGSTAAISGPGTKYPTGELHSVKDANFEQNKVEWYIAPQGISESTPYAYIASRTREAGQDWTKKSFSIAKYGNYAFDSLTLVRFFILHANNTVPDPNKIDPDTLLTLGWNWDKAVMESKLKTGTNKIYMIVGNTVNGVLLATNKVEGKEALQPWPEPSLISIINK